MDRYQATDAQATEDGDVRTIDICYQLLMTTLWHLCSIEMLYTSKYRTELKHRLDEWTFTVYTCVFTLIYVLYVYTALSSTVSTPQSLASERTAQAFLNIPVTALLTVPIWALYTSGDVNLTQSSVATFMTPFWWVTFVAATLLGHIPTCTALYYSEENHEKLE